MWDDDEARCVRAIETGVVDDVVPSRRQRTKVLAADRDGDIAAVVLATRGKRRDGSLSVTSFSWDGHRWRNGNSSSSRSTDAPRLPDRSSIPARSVTMETRGRGLRSSVRFAAVRAGDDVVELRWRETESTVSPTGYAAVVWRERMPDLVGLDRHGEEVARLTHHDTLSPQERMPLRVRLEYEYRKRRHPGEWFNYSVDR